MKYQSTTNFWRLVLQQRCPQSRPELLRPRQNPEYLPEYGRPAPPQSAGGDVRTVSIFS